MPNHTLLTHPYGHGDQSTGNGYADAVWATLSDPAHAEGFADHGEANAPKRRLVASLSGRPYAGSLSAYNSLTTFVITFAAGHSEREGHDEVTVRFSPETGVFGVAYAEWVSATRNPTHRIAAGRSCSEGDVLSVVDLYVLRLHMTDGQTKR